MSTSEHKLRPNKCNWVAGTRTNKAGAAAVETPAATGAVAAMVTRVTAAATAAAVGMAAITATPAVGPAVVGVEVEVAGVPTPTTAAATTSVSRYEGCTGGYK